MKKSPYSDMVNGAINDGGGDFGILKDFSEIVKKTVITYRTDRKKSLIAYYDSKDLYICEALGNPDDFPLLGSVEEISKRKKYQQSYDRGHTTSFHIKLTDSSDQDIIDFLNSQDNKQCLIKKLLREEMEKQEKNTENTRG